MKIAARRGNRLHAPEDSRIAQVSAYTAGADVLELAAHLTADGQVVVSHEHSVKGRTGQDGAVAEMTLRELRALDFSETFQPRGGSKFHFFDPAVAGRRLQIETLSELLDFLPEDAELLLELKHDESLSADLREPLVKKTIDSLHGLQLEDRVVVYSKDLDSLRLARRFAPRLRVCAWNDELSVDERIELVQSLGADGIVTGLEGVVSAAGELTNFGRQLEAVCRERQLAVGAILFPQRNTGVFSKVEYDALRQHGFVWAVATDSVLDVAPFVRRSLLTVDADFAGETVDRHRFALGYAKANRYGHAYQRDGIHMEIDPYDKPPPSRPEGALERRIADLEEEMMYVAKDWPFYSGGGLGVLQGIRGNFAAEVDYTTEVVAQATTLEMAVLNVDPGAHQANRPTSIRQKDSFYDPHGAPPYVGVEHDEDDGYRINWNLGSEYDNNQYGRPVGDGKNSRGARLRLERRGPYFAAYYRNQVDASDWVCVGVVRNDSLNPVVYLRCAGKRWRQEDENDPSQFVPIVANHFIFKNLTITRFPH